MIKIPQQKTLMCVLFPYFDRHNQNSNQSRLERRMKISSTHFSTTFCVIHLSVYISRMFVLYLIFLKLHTISPMSTICFIPHCMMPRKKKQHTTTNKFRNQLIKHFRMLPRMTRYKSFRSCWTKFGWVFSATTTTAI
jgi:hypothetical protein